MNHSAIRAFHAIVENGGVTRAAAALGLTQPTLSDQAKRLQERHRVRLIQRSGRGVEPTEQGHALHALTRRLFQVEEEIDDFLATAGDPGRGRLRLGADAPAHIIPALAAFARRHPRMRLSLSLGNSRKILTELLERRCDVAVIPDLPRDRRLYTVSLRDDRLIALVPRGHPWARRGRIAIGELVRQAVALREPGSRTRAVLQTALEHADMRLETTLEIGSREGVLEAVAAGLGVGVIFASEFRPDPRLRALEITGALTRSREYGACLASQRDVPAVKAFLAATLEQAGRAQPMTP